jgi:hypothetical protein
VFSIDWDQWRLTAALQHTRDEQHTHAPAWTQRQTKMLKKSHEVDVHKN